MTRNSTPPPPRLVPGRTLPPYAYIPGQHPHPARDPEGHSYGAVFETPIPPESEEWRTSLDYLYGIDLFNYGFYWEAHEAWEGLWVACGREGPMATYLQALINLAAAGFKARWGNARGMRANASTAHRLFKSFASQRGIQGGRYMGLDVRALTDYAGTISQSDMAPKSPPGDRNPLEFDLVLRPE